MTIAVIKDTVCTDICEFADLDTAKAFLNAGAWQGATAVVELSEGFGIGDTYTDGTWTKQEEPAEEAPVDKIAELEAENKTLTAKLTAASNQIEMLESCIIEIAQTVYA